MAPACGGGSRASELPVPALSTTVEAQRAYRQIESRWTDLPPERRGELEPDLRDFLNRFAADDRSRLVRSWLAWLEIDQKRPDVAVTLVEPVREGPPGAARDFAGVVEARALLQQGKVVEALGLLQPLRGKLVDPEVRGLYSEELVRALVESVRYGEALHSMMNWADETPTTERDEVISTIESQLRSMPATALESGLGMLLAEDKSDSSEQRPSGLGARRWLIGAVRRELSRIALTSRDPELARRLLESSRTSLERGESRDALAALAATSAVAPRVLGRSIGVVLDVADDVSRRRSAELVEGMTRALGLPASAARADAVQLITREAAEPGDVERALAGLAGDGATLLVAGVTDESAVAASVFAERAKLPVVLVQGPASAGGATGFTFVLGGNRADEEGAVASALETAGAKNPARVGPGGAACDAESPSPAVSRFPVLEWKKHAVDAIVLGGDADCSRDAAADAENAGLNPTFILGLESADRADYVSGRRLVLSAGRFPFDPRSTDSEERAYIARWGRGPSWYETMGHDAAVLGAAALARFPLERVDDERAVEALHVRAKEGLSTAKAALWSTLATGFAGGNSIRRDIGVSAVSDTPR